MIAATPLLFICLRKINMKHNHASSDTGYTNCQHRSQSVTINVIEDIGTSIKLPRGIYDFISHRLVNVTEWIGENE